LASGKTLANFMFAVMLILESRLTVRGSIDGLIAKEAYLALRYTAGEDAPKAEAANKMEITWLLVEKRETHLFRVLSM
jgi:hypothetical protein